MKLKFSFSISLTRPVDEERDSDHTGTHHDVLAHEEIVGFSIPDRAVE
jgi:hypothetical protein